MTRGIWYEKDRDRYRVRLYYNGHVVHRSYHKTSEEAEQVHERAKTTLDSMTTDEKEELIKPQVSTDSLAGLIEGIKATTKTKPTLI